MKGKFNESIELAAAAFVDAKPKKIVLISHNDADGIASLVLLQTLLAKKQVSVQHFIFNREKSWAEFFKPLLGKKQENTAFILTDLGGELSEIARLFEGRPELVVVLDHHQPLQDDTPFPENVLVSNPVLFGLDGLKEVAGAAVTYLFAKQIDLNAIKLAWLAVIGISGDSLMHIDELRSYNKEIYEEAVSEGQVVEKAGACFYGATHEKLKNALAWSILPYLPQIQSDPEKAESLLQKLQISPNKIVESLEEAEVERLVEALGPTVAGSIAIFPKNQGLLRYAFEHAILLNILGFKEQNIALQAISSQNPSSHMKQQYLNHVTNLSKNLTAFSQLPRIEGSNSVIVDVEGVLPPSSWSDTASFSSVNKIFDPTKMLFMAGKEEEKIKFSVRCSREFIETHQGENVNSVIQLIRKDFNAMGGGHPLAGGLKISPHDYARFKQTLENYF